MNPFLDYRSCKTEPFQLTHTAIVIYRHLFKLEHTLRNAWWKVCTVVFSHILQCVGLQFRCTPSTIYHLHSMSNLCKGFCHSGIGSEILIALIIIKPLLHGCSANGKEEFGLWAVSSRRLVFQPLMRTPEVEEFTSIPGQVTHLIFRRMYHTQCTSMNMRRDYLQCRFNSHDPSCLWLFPLLIWFMLRQSLRYTVMDMV